MGRLACAVNELELAHDEALHANWADPDALLDALMGLVDAAKAVIDNWDNG